MIRRELLRRLLSALGLSLVRPPKIELPKRRPTYARLSGAGPVYGFREVVRDRDGWRDGPLRGDVCEVNGASNPAWDGRIVLVHRCGTPGDWCFYDPTC